MGDSKIESLVQKWSDMYTTEVLEFAKPKDVSNEEVFSDVYHSLVPSVAADTLVRLEHSNAMVKRHCFSLYYKIIWILWDYVLIVFKNIHRYFLYSWLYVFAGDWRKMFAPWRWAAQIGPKTRSRNDSSGWTSQPRSGWCGLFVFFYFTIKIQSRLN